MMLWEITYSHYVMKYGERILNDNYRAVTRCLSSAWLVLKTDQLILRSRAAVSEEEAS